MTLNVAWDLLSIPHKIKNIELAKQQDRIADLRRLGLAMAITTQVEIAKAALDEASNYQYYRAKIYNNDKEIYYIQRDKTKIDFASELALAKAYAKMVESKIAYDKAYSDYHIAAATLLESIGYDPVSYIENVNLPIKQIQNDIAQLSNKYFRQLDNLDNLLNPKPVKQKVIAQAKINKVQPVNQAKAKVNGKQHA